MADAEEKESSPSLVQQLLSLDIEEHQADSDTAKFQKLRVRKAADYTALDSTDFKRFKEDLPLVKELPLAPTLDQDFLFKGQHSKAVRLLFEDSWSSLTVNYAQTVDLFTHLLRILDQHEVSADDEIRKSARRLLLLAQNAQARLLQQYKYLVTRHTLKGARAPGSSKDSLLTSTELKTICTTLETGNKIQRLSAQARRSQAQAFTAAFSRRRQQTPNSYYPYRPRGRGNNFYRRGRGGGRRGRGRGQQQQQ